MKITCQFAVLIACLLFVTGCQTEVEVSQTESPTTDSGKTTKVVNRVVEASCGECQFGMEGNGCDLAVRIDGKSYYVDGAQMDDHGDAHGEDGMCNCVRQATVSGEVKDGRFVSTAFELKPFDKEAHQADKREQLKKSRLGAAFTMSDEGLVVADILAEGAAGMAGLKKGDKIVKLNDKAVAEMDPDAIRAAFTESSTVGFSILRDGESMEFSVELKEK